MIFKLCVNEGYECMRVIDTEAIVEARVWR